VSGNATLFDGSLIETEKAVSDLSLIGAKVRLAAGSRATVFNRKAVLEIGYGELQAAGPYELEARSLRIAPISSHGAARVRIAQDRKITVAAVGTGVRVRNASGILVAHIEAGSALDLEPQEAGAAAPTRVSGCLLSKLGRHVLVDQTTNVVLELEGLGLAQEVGNRVSLAGSVSAARVTVEGASQVIRVAGMQPVAKGGCDAVAKRIGASPSHASSAVTAGSGSAGTVVIIGGVAAAATIGGLAAAGVFPGDGEPQASR
jgi:hypothetical protein